MLIMAITTSSNLDNTLQYFTTMTKNNSSVKKVSFNFRFPTSQTLMID